ncbi:MAG: hypothetical protein JWM40_2266 [Frankiales bacterium]|nr:hypothetical protein [Frankiales bacterium]
MHLAGSGKALLALGHGAGGGTDAWDLLAARAAALELGWRVALIDQPWRVRGAKVAEAPPRLDRAWIEVLTTLRAKKLVVGGRSAGARVACRTAAEVGAAGVLCLAFPLHPPGKPDTSRAHELLLPTVPVAVIQGERDAFGVPAGAIVIAGANHSFTVPRTYEPAVPQISAAVREVLQTLT